MQQQKTASTEAPASAVEDGTAPHIEVETTEEPIVTLPAVLPTQASDLVSVITSTCLFFGVDDIKMLPVVLLNSVVLNFIILICCKIGAFLVAFSSMMLL